MSDFAAVVLAGGQGSRLGGVDKAALVVRGRTLLEGVLDALADAQDVVVVGPRRTLARPVRWTMEQPPGGGPVAAIAAALPLLDQEFVLVCATDLPDFGARTVHRLLAELQRNPRCAGVVLRDEHGRDQWLTGAWRTEALRRALPADPDGAALYKTIGALPVARIDARAGEAKDIDTPEDLRSVTGEPR